MATKKGPSKKVSSKKSAGKQSAKKSSKKSSKRLAGLAGPSFPSFPPPNLRCILACAQQYGRCLQKGVSPALCEKRFMRCVQNCISGSGIFTAEDE